MTHDKMNENNLKQNIFGLDKTNYADRKEGKNVWNVKNLCR